MLIRKIRKSVSWKMISQLNHLFISPIYEKGSNSHSPQNFSSLNIRCFRSSHNPKVSVPESTTQTPISVAVNKMSRVTRTDAQAALFDYLHCTRGFNYVDAEHISKNSPHFLQSLLSKVDNDQDITRALTRFFRYHPINEFEPFLESLGLSQSKLTSMLPRNLIFLSDDSVLLDNYHVLCDYGIPRVKMGKIYKEATEIFRYDYGVLDMKLKAYEKLGLSRSTVIKLVTCSPTLLLGEMNSELIKVLEKLKILGFENDWIGGYLSNRHSYNWGRMLHTLHFLNEVGYSDEKMAALFKMNPAFLFEGSGKRIYVLVGQLLKLGLKMSDIYSLFCQNPNILSLKCAKNLWQALYFLLEIGLETEIIANIVSTHIQLLGSHSLKGPKTVLRGFKGDKCRLCETIKEDPLNLFRLASKSKVSLEQMTSQNPGKLFEKTTFLLRVGYLENSDEMAKALKQFRGRGDQLQERFDCLVNAGLDCNVVINMIKQAPTALNQSKNVLEKKMDLLKTYLGYPVESIASFPSYLCYDVDRVHLRFSMYAWLKQKGAAKPRLSVSTLLACSDARFVKYFVDIHPEGPAMWENLKSSLQSS
ncbi:PREDICTED: transcription termination factor MTEF18, mitochondrial [Nicotiana attenuata]|uniref:Transcription termination factor mtef18, mitochondrial n=1 Tax=Nicotiana attenuata TaxID=49451 RepID=A0A1J6HTT1_NICAT|nr:PREDICTED: transcription termination factor MTEF18, mitochondrial [Nicotiana attenuata]OIS96300.1 transcription termination factor mtef18, mitochondrial [Nicotiana attenuata]